MRRSVVCRRDDGTRKCSRKCLFAAAMINGEKWRECPRHQPTSIIGSYSSSEALLRKHVWQHMRAEIKARAFAREISCRGENLDVIRVGTRKIFCGRNSYGDISSSAAVNGTSNIARWRAHVNDAGHSCRESKNRMCVRPQHLSHPGPLC